MDEATLTRTLQELAARPVLHSAPSADARARARRLQRRRRTGAAAAAVILAAGVVGVVQLHRAPDTNAGGGKHQTGLSDRSNPNHPTSGTLVVLDAKTGTARDIYWQGTHLCVQVAAYSDCGSVDDNPRQSITVANIGQNANIGGLFASVAPSVFRVRVARPDGTTELIEPLPGNGFPSRVVVADGKVVSLRALDAAGKQIGEPVRGPDALQLRQVMAVAPCTSSITAGHRVPDTTGNSCYALEQPSLTLLPASAGAVDDSDQGWVVNVAITGRDSASFADLTRRVAQQSAPRNQLAMVLNGTVLSAPTVNEAIAGGVFQISGGDKPFTAQEAESMAARIRG